VIEILRRVTRLVQLAPFVYLALYSLYLFAGVFVSEESVCLADGAMFGSPLVTILFLTLSRLLKLCKWHKVACLIPSASQMEGVVDCYFFTFTQNEIILINVMLGILSFLFLIFANKRFFSNGR
jgi:hypothetical protein